MSSERPIRILHISKYFTMGGMESWLHQALRRMDPERFHMDFLGQVYEPSVHLEPMQALGMTFFVSDESRSPEQTARTFSDILRHFGAYDIVHCHSLFDGARFLKLACRHGVPVRIVHARTVRPRVGPLLRMRLRVRRWRLSRYMTAGLAVSRAAGETLFGPGWERPPFFRVMYSGIDPEPFRAPVNRKEVRAELGLPQDAFVVGHVGRFSREKRHDLLLDMAALLARRAPETCLLFVGDGSLRDEVARKAAALGLSDRVVFAGLRDDVPRVLRAMDAFALPSLYEGLPIVGLEAQAAGLPTIVSDAVTAEMDVCPGLVGRIPLSAPVETWVEALLDVRRGARISPRDAVRALEESPFNIARSVRAMEDFYRECLAHAGHDIPSGHPSAPAAVRD